VRRDGDRRIRSKERRARNELVGDYAGYRSRGDVEIAIVAVSHSSRGMKRLGMARLIDHGRRWRREVSNEREQEEVDLASTTRVVRFLALT